MTLYRSALCALAMFVVVPAVGGASAETLPKHNQVRVTATVHFVDDWQGETAFLRVVGGGGDTPASGVTATIASDRGSEDVTLVESDAWLHGAAKLAALPKTEATLTLTLYDKGSASLMSFSGTLGADGTVALTADAGKDTGTDCAARTGCPKDTPAAGLDIEVLAGEVFAASGGFELGLDLAGVDTYAVAYAAVTVTESGEVTTCDKVDGCTTTGSTTTTKTEVDWDDIGAVWEGELTMEPAGIVDVKVKTYDAAGKQLESTKAALAAPWLDAGEGVNVLAVDEDPSTAFGILGRRVDVTPNGDITWVASSLAVASDGWTATTVPVSAQIELTNGGTITIPVNSYHRGARLHKEVVAAFKFEVVDSLTVTGGGIVFVDESLGTLRDSPICASGGCFMLVPNGDGGYDLSVSEYGTDAVKLADELELTVTVTDEAGTKVFSETETLAFDDVVTAVFASEVSFSADPIGLDLSGKLSLLGAADENGKQQTLAKGNFYGSFSRDGDGDLNLGGADKNVVSSQGGIVTAGTATTVELTTDTNKDGVLNGPPLAVVSRGIDKSSLRRGMAVAR